LQAITNSLVNFSGLEEIPEDLINFFSFITRAQSSIPASFLSPFENKIIKFQTGFQRIRVANHPRDSFLILGAFLVSKVLVQKMFFKPYKMAKLFKIPDSTRPAALSENCVMMGYTILALYTEIVFHCYRDVLIGEDDQIASREIKTKCKIFKDLLPPNDDGVVYSDFL
jgi:hypothetical protein